MEKALWGPPCPAGPSAPELAAQQRVAALELVDRGAGDRAHPGFAIDAALDLAVRLARAAGEVADQAAALGPQALAGLVRGLAGRLAVLGRGGGLGDDRLLHHRLRIVGGEELERRFAHDRLVQLGVAGAQGGEAGTGLA